MRAAVASSAVGVQDAVLPYNKNFHLAFQHKNLPSLLLSLAKKRKGPTTAPSSCNESRHCPSLDKGGFFMAKCRLGGCKVDNRV